MSIVQDSLLEIELSFEEELSLEELSEELSLEVEELCSEVLDDEDSDELFESEEDMLCDKLDLTELDFEE